MPPSATSSTSRVVAGLEPDGGARGDVQPHAVRLRAIERQRAIDLEEVTVRADLDRTVAAVGHRRRVTVGGRR